MRFKPQGPLAIAEAKHWCAQLCGSRPAWKRCFLRQRRVPTTVARRLASALRTTATAAPIAWRLHPADSEAQFRRELRNVLRAGGVLERCPLTRDGRNSVHPSLMIVVVDLLDREVGEHDLKHGRRTPAGGGPAWPLGQRPPAHAPATVCQSSVCMHRSNRCDTLNSQNFLTGSGGWAKNRGAVDRVRER